MAPAAAHPICQEALMLRYLATGLLTRNVSRRLARMIPNPLARTVAIAAAGYAVNRVVNGRAVRGYRPGQLPA
jgi:hypothetical protein